MRHMRNRKTKGRKQVGLNNRMPLVSITLVVISLAVAVNVKSAALRDKERQLSAQEASLQQQLSEEEQRNSQLQEQSVYVQTKEYIEKIAKEKLGLVNKGEVILKPSEKK
jgi:cell division protein FtsB